MDSIESGTNGPSDPVGDAFHASRDDDRPEDAQEAAAVGMSDDDTLYFRIYVGFCTVFFLVSATILLMSPFSLSKISPSSRLFNLLVTHSPGLFASLFISNTISIAAIYVLSSYATLFMYSLLASIVLLLAACCLMVSSSALVALVLFAVLLSLGVMYKNIIKSFPQAVKVAQLTCLVAKKNSYFLLLILAACQGLSLVFSGVWFVIFSHSLLLGFNRFYQPSLYLFSFTSLSIGSFLVVFYIWTCSIIGDLQKMLTTFVIMEWWKSHASELEGRTFSEEPSTLTETDLVDCVCLIISTSFGSICFSTFSASFLRGIELLLRLVKRAVGLFYPFGFLDFIISWVHHKRSLASSLALINIVNQPHPITLTSSYVQLQRILHYHQVHVVAPGLLHWLLDLLSFLVSIIIAIIALFLNEGTTSYPAAIAAIATYWIIGGAVNKALFRVIRDVADSILLCHIRSVDGRTMEAK